MVSILLVALSLIIFTTSSSHSCCDSVKLRLIHLTSTVFQVEPLFSRQLLYYAQQMGAHYYRSYEHAAGVADHISASEEYQRAVSHHHNGSLQE